MRRLAEPAPSANISGKAPTTVAIDVMTMGRKRMLAASMMASIEFELYAVTERDGDQTVKQQGWAEMNLIHDRAAALVYHVLAECGVDPDREALRRAWSSTATTMDGAPEVAALALRVCGGRSMLRPSYLEQAYRLGHEY